MTKRRNCPNVRAAERNGSVQDAFPLIDKSRAGSRFKVCGEKRRTNKCKRIAIPLRSPGLGEAKSMTSTEEW